MPVITISGRPMVVTQSELDALSANCKYNTIAQTGSPIQQLAFEQSQRERVTQGVTAMKNPTVKYKLADHMRNSMHMPDEMLPYLITYVMRHYHVPQFKDELVDGTITINCTRFNVIYHQCTPAAAKSAKEIRLSFRVALPEFGIEPYVLVQIVNQ